MSPALKEAVPVGTLASHVLPNKATPTDVRKQLNLASQGWRSHTFKSVSDKLSAASSRLQSDAERESKYWAQVADLTSRGWPVSRLPRDSRAIGVHFGFAEAAPQFRDRGFALLRQLDDGIVSLDNRRKRRRLGVYVTRGSNTTGAFHFHTTQKVQHIDINRQITEARDALFEEELFHEISREARLIANQGIITHGQAIDIVVGSHYQISLVFAEDHKKATSLKADDCEIAEFVGMSLRLLLNAAHEQNLARRSQRPPVMTLKPRSTPEYAIIRPILAHLRHRTQLTTLWSSCDRQIRPFTASGLSLSITAKSSNAEVLKSLQIESSSSILSDLMLPARTAFELNLTSNKGLQIGLATFLGPPLFGSRFETSEIDFGFLSTPLSHHETVESVIYFIRHILLLDLVAHVESRASQAGRSHQGLDPTKSIQWKVSRPHSGLVTQYVSGEAVKTIQITVQAQSISLKLTQDLVTDSSKYVIWSWSTSQGYSKTESKGVSHEPFRKFDDVLAEILDS